MPPAKKAAASSGSKTATHASYRDMIKDAIVNLKERNGSSRQKIKKYVQNNNRIAIANQSTFDAQFNRALKSGVEKEEFLQPKGPSGPVKLAKKEAPAKPAPKAAPKAAPKKAAATKKTTTKKAPAKAEKATKKAAPKKAAATKTKTKANTTKQRKVPAAAPAVVDVPKITTTTKSGRVTKTTAKPAPKRAAPKKKAAAKKATPRKSAA